MDLRAYYHSPPPCPLSYTVASSHGHLGCYSSNLIFASSIQSAVSFPDGCHHLLFHTPSLSMLMLEDRASQSSLPWEVLFAGLGCKLNLAMLTALPPSLSLSLKHSTGIPPQLLSLHPLNHVKVLWLHQPSQAAVDILKNVAVSKYERTVQMLVFCCCFFHPGGQLSKKEKKRRTAPLHLIKNLSNVLGCNMHIQYNASAYSVT